MAKMTRAEVRETVGKWAALSFRIRKLEDAKGKAVKTFNDAHGAELAAIDEAHDPKIFALTSERAVLERQVIAWLEEYRKPVTIDAGGATAANVEKAGNRVLPPQRFFDYCKEKNGQFWECVTIAIGRADAFLGKQAVTELSDKPTKIEASLTLSK
ncbi:MAG: hypothetical protein IT174_10665 [Acidobacteria bacterium]|nr:hypothetical protein [Acidobacteriota bacterium]